MTETTFGKNIAEQTHDNGENAPSNVEIKFDIKKGTILLGLGNSESIDSQFADKYTNEGYSPKPELHMTVLGFKQGKGLGKLIKEQPDLAEKVNKLLSDTEWDIQPTGERYHVEKQVEGEDVKRESVIEMVNVPQLTAFMDQLNSVTGLNLEEQPPHVTLMTKGNPQGIGINTAQEMVDLAPQRIE